MQFVVLIFQMFEEFTGWIRYKIVFLWTDKKQNKYLYASDKISR
jgi:hypothetical protein